MYDFKKLDEMVKEAAQEKLDLLTIADMKANVAFLESCIWRGIRIAMDNFQKNKKEL